MTDRFKPPFRKIHSKLTRKQVEEIRELYYKTHLTQAELSRRYSVSTVQIGRIVRGESWGENQTAEEARLEEIERKIDAGEMPPAPQSEVDASMARLRTKLGLPDLPPEEDRGESK